MSPHSANKKKIDFLLKVQKFSLSLFSVTFLYCLCNPFVGHSLDHYPTPFYFFIKICDRRVWGWFDGQRSISKPRPNDFTLMLIKLVEGIPLAGWGLDGRPWPAKEWPTNPQLNQHYFVCLEGPLGQKSPTKVRKINKKK